jgi:hypothetical protein
VPRKATTDKTPVKRTVKKRTRTASPKAVVPANEKRELDREEVARLAYSYWQERGCRGGSAEEDWRRAEETLQTRLNGLA